uniref:Uncharacterized protein n=1 Tax=Neovison vison TaxID=452646 RepID=A0A8C7ERU1_NEOVI
HGPVQHHSSKTLLVFLNLIFWGAVESEVDRSFHKVCKTYNELNLMLLAGLLIRYRDSFTVVEFTTSQAGKTDWFKETKNQSDPLSCSGEAPSSYNESLAHPSDFYAKGCGDLVVKRLLEVMMPIIWAALVFAAIQLLGMLCACIILCRSRNPACELLLTSGGYYRGHGLHGALAVVKK